jgi:hypothetical protein
MLVPQSCFFKCMINFQWLAPNISNFFFVSKTQVTKTVCAASLVSQSCCDPPPRKCSSCAQQIWFLHFLFQNNLLHTASRAVSSTSWFQSLSQFWTGSWVGSLMSHNDIAELLLQFIHVYTCHSTFSWRQFYFFPSPSSLPACLVDYTLPHHIHVQLDNSMWTS